MGSRLLARAGLVVFLALGPGSTAPGGLRVPAFTAYLDPDPNGATVSRESGVSDWRDPGLKVLWFGELKTSGSLECAVTLRLSVGRVSRLRLTVAGQTHEAEAQGEEDRAVTLGFGSFTIPAAGYQRFTLESLNAAGRPFGDVEALVLDGPAADNAHFNLDPRRNAASVHLRYHVPDDTKAAAFYCEVTGLEDPAHTFYMACGWHRGYLGMQINSSGERRIIFSVWDAHQGADDRNLVSDLDRVALVASGAEVVTGEFGHEGSGGHSHLVYNWKTGEPQRFMVTARPVTGGFTIYSGHYFRPDRKQWMLISSWRAPKDGGWMRGLHSFSENFDGSNGHLRRKALFGNQWVRTDSGQWIELTSAGFSYDATGRASRLDRVMGVEAGRFFLAHGGFLPGLAESGERFSRPATGEPPGDFTFLKSSGD